MSFFHPPFQDDVLFDEVAHFDLGIPVHMSYGRLDGLYWLVQSFRDVMGCAVGIIADEVQDGYAEDIIGLIH